METKLKTYTIEEVCKGFVYNEYEGKGLYGLAGKLVIQPEYQRNYIYADGKKDVDVIKSVLKGYPLGLLYFNRRPDGMLEVLDGQQRITSLGRFYTGHLSVTDDDGNTQKFTGSLAADLKERFCKSELLVYECEGTESEIKAWFKVINIAGVPLNEQELLNAVYSGPFVTKCKEVWSNSHNANTKKWQHYIKGDVKRQDYLACALSWISAHKDVSVDEYMSSHRQDEDISEVLSYFDSVMGWVDSTFITVRKEMKGLPWGSFYEKYHSTPYDAAKVEERVAALFADECVTVKRNIFEYVLGGEAKPELLEVRFFDKSTIATTYAKQTEEAKKTGLSNCPLCAAGTSANRTRVYKLEEMDADHVTAWSRGGQTSAANCQMLCRTHNRSKGNK